jgi:hypothetical protein
VPGHCELPAAGGGFTLHEPAGAPVWALHDIIPPLPIVVHEFAFTASACTEQKSCGPALFAEQNSPMPLLLHVPAWAPVNTEHTAPPWPEPVPT